MCRRPWFRKTVIPPSLKPFAAVVGEAEATYQSRDVLHLGNDPPYEQTT
jgi:hypothetical protein